MGFEIRKKQITLIYNYTLNIKKYLHFIPSCLKLRHILYLELNPFLRTRSSLITKPR